MERRLAGSHALSAALHFTVLALAFTAPVTMVIKMAERTSKFERTVTTRPVDVDFPAPPPPVEDDRFDVRGVGDVAGEGEGSGSARPTSESRGDRPADGPGHATLVDDDEARGEALLAETRSILGEVTTPAAGMEIEGILAGLDDGGGSHRPTFRGFGLGGSGATCGRYWEMKKGKVVTHRTDPCEAQRIAGMRGRGSLGYAERSRPKPDLGEREEEPVVHVVAGEPTTCADSTTPCPWRDIIEGVIRRHLRELKFCYERTLHRQARPLATEIDVSFSIPPDGGVATVNFTRPTGVERFDRCARSRMERWVFPKTEEEIIANYPFRFRPS